MLTCEYPDCSRERDHHGACRVGTLDLHRADVMHAEGCVGCLAFDVEQAPGRAAHHVRAIRDHEKACEKLLARARKGDEEAFLDLHFRAKRIRGHAARAFAQLLLRWL